MNARFRVLFALCLACAPIASAQVVVTPSLRYPRAYPSLTGTWNVEIRYLENGTLTLNQQSNNVLLGTWTPPYRATNAYCRGEYRGPGFVVMCQETGWLPIVIVGHAASLGFTLDNTPPNIRMRGVIYQALLSEDDTRLYGASFNARRN